MLWPARGQSMARLWPHGCTTGTGPPPAAAPLRPAAQWSSFSPWPEHWAASRAARDGNEVLAALALPAAWAKSGSKQSLCAQFRVSSRPLAARFSPLQCSRTLTLIIFSPQTLAGPKAWAPKRSSKPAAPSQQPTQLAHQLACGRTPRDPLAAQTRRPSSRGLLAARQPAASTSRKVRWSLAPAPQIVRPAGLWPLLQPPESASWRRWPPGPGGAPPTRPLAKNGPTPAGGRAVRSISRSRAPRPRGRRGTRSPRAPPNLRVRAVSAPRPPRSKVVPVRAGGNPNWGKFNLARICAPVWALACESGFAGGRLLSSQLGVWWASFWAELAERSASGQRASRNE